MKRHILRRLFALCLALTLLAPALAAAEEVVVVQANDGAGTVSDAPEAGVEEVEGLLNGMDGWQDGGLAPASNALELGVQEKYTLSASSIAPGKKLTYQSTKTSVATVSKKGVITGKKKGTAKIKCYVGKKLVATYTVKVLAAPKRVSLSPGAISIGVKESVALTPSVTKGSRAVFTWSSKNKKVATVTKAGVVKGVKAGKTTVTVKTQNGLSASVTVTVGKKPGKVTLNKKKASLDVGGTLKLKATLASGAASYKMTWTSSDTTVATVGSTGKVTAIGAGEATIQVATYNGKTASCAVTVKDPNDITDTSVEYRALIIGEEYFSWESELCTRNRGDVNLMCQMLSSVKGLYGNSFHITYGIDLTNAEILRAISSVFADADDNDVSLFFIATHGDASSGGIYAGALATSPDGDLLLSDLANALKAVPGKVIVCLESCGAGAAVYGNSASGSRSAQDAAKDFDQSVIKAFSAADPGILVEVPSGGLKSNGVVSNTGEFRLENKFYVLAASAYQELSWGTYNWNFFTKWLTDGVGTSGHMAADTNYNSQTTLNELYKYISSVGDSYALRADGETYYQHVQVYPANSGYVLFTR